MAHKPGKTFQPQALTANALVGGEVLYWQRSGSWADDFENAHIFDTSDEMEPALAEAEKDVLARRILDPYFFVVTVEGGTTTPASVREQIRAKGPTVRLDLGKQAAA